MASLLDDTGKVLTPDMLDQRRKLAQALYQQNSHNYAQPGGAWMGVSDGVSKIGAAMSQRGFEDRQNAETQKATAANNASLDSYAGGLGGPTGMPGMAPPTGPAVPGDTGVPNFMGGTGAMPGAKPNPYPTTQPAAGGPTPPPFLGAPSSGGDIDRWKAAISNNESGGRYDLLGPVIPKTGDRAYGKYQVMGNNIPEWTTAALGAPMTKEQFLASPDAQEKVFEHQFGGYVKKYGNPEDAASAWFTGGPRNAKTAASKDVLGTSGAGYVNKFDSFLGQNPQGAAQPPQGGPPGMQAASASPTGAVWDVPFQNLPSGGPPPPPQDQPKFGEQARAGAAMSGTDTSGAQPFGAPGAPYQPPATQAPPPFNPQPQGGQMGGFGGQQDPRQAFQAIRPLMAALSNPWTPPAQAKLIEAMLQPYIQQLGPVNYTTVTQPDGSVWAVNPRNPTDARQVAPATKHYISVAGDFGRHKTIDEYSGLEAPGQQAGGQPMPQGGMPQGQQPMAGGPQDQGGLVQGVDIIQGPGGIPMLSPTGLKKIGQEGDTVPWFQDPANGFWKRSDGTGILSPLALQQKIQATAAERRSQPVTTKAGATTSGTIEDAIAGMNAPGYKSPSFVEPQKTGNRIDDALDYYGQRDTFGQSNAIPGMAGGKVVTVDFPNEATEARKSAQDVAKSAGDVASLQAEQAILRRNLDALNNQGGSYLNTGTGGRERLNVARAFNTIGTMFGLKDEDLPFDPKQLAAGADLSKIATLQGLQNSRIAGAREAQAIVQQSINATANMENSPSENNLVLADMMQIAQQKMDYAKFASKYLSKYPKSDGISLSEAFVEAYPPEEYANAAVKQAADWDAARAKAGGAPGPPPPAQTTQAGGAPGAAQAAAAPVPPEALAPYAQAAQVALKTMPPEQVAASLKAKGLTDAEVAMVMQPASQAPPQAQPPPVQAQGSPPAPVAAPPAVQPPPPPAPAPGARLLGDPPDAFATAAQAPPAQAQPPAAQPPQTAPAAPPQGPYGAPIGDRSGADAAVLQTGTPPPPIQMLPPPPPPIPFDAEKLRASAQQFVGPPPTQAAPPAQAPKQSLNIPHWQPNAPVPGPIPGAGINVTFPKTNEGIFGRGIDVQFGSPPPQPRVGSGQATSVSAEPGQKAAEPSRSDVAITPIRTTTQGRDAILAGQNPTAVAKGLLLGGIDPGRAAQTLILAGVPPDKAKSIIAAAQRTLR